MGLLGDWVDLDFILQSFKGQNIQILRFEDRQGDVDCASRELDTGSYYIWQRHEVILG